MAKVRNPWEKARSLENRYARALRGVARQVGSIVEGISGGGARLLSEPAALAAVRNALDKYAHLLRPWAEATAGRLLADLDRQDKAAWGRNARHMAKALRDELATSEVGATLRSSMAQQVQLITSLPIEAGERVQGLVLKGLENSSRAGEIAQRILETEDVTKSRATTIARTEVSTISSNLVKARALHIGSEGYIWRTSKDADVRDSHAKMEGKFVRWDSPPTLDGMVGHAGCLPNCRCFPEPVIPEDL